jgi:hypothetical protein
MTKKQKTIFIVVAIIFIVAFIVNRFIPEIEKVLPNPTPTPKSDEPEVQRIEVNGVDVKNFYDQDTNVNSRGDATFVNQENYGIVYFSNEEQFLISIFSSPFDEVRKEAEKQFLKELGIDKSEACSLNVIITTPVSVNPENAGINYRLSFCK